VDEALVLCIAAMVTGLVRLVRLPWLTCSLMNFDNVNCQGLDLFGSGAFVKRRLIRPLRPLVLSASIMRQFGSTTHRSLLSLYL